MDSVFSVLFPTTLRSVRLSLCPGFCPCRMVSHHTQFCLSFCKSFIMSILYGFQPHTFLVVCMVFSFCMVHTTLSSVYLGICLFCMGSHHIHLCLSLCMSWILSVLFYFPPTQFYFSFRMSWIMTILYGYQPHPVLIVFLYVLESLNYVWSPSHLVK